MAGPDLIDGSVVALVAGVSTALVWASGRAAHRAGLQAVAIRRLRVLVSVVLAGWLALTAAAAAGGWLRRWDAVPPRLALLPLVVLVTMVLLNRLPGFARLLVHVPPWWPIAAQVFRVGVELVLLAYYGRGLVPRQMTLEGRNLDLLVGLTAPVMAVLIARGRASRPLVLGWNALGLASLVNVAYLAVTSAPGALHRNWPGEPLTLVGHWPAVWIPALLLPSAVALHVISIRRTLNSSASTAPREAVAA